VPWRTIGLRQPSQRERKQRVVAIACLRQRVRGDRTDDLLAPCLAGGEHGLRGAKGREKPPSRLASDLGRLEQPQPGGNLIRVAVDGAHVSEAPPTCATFRAG